MDFIFSFPTWVFSSLSRSCLTGSARAVVCHLEHMQHLPWLFSVLPCESVTTPSLFLFPWMFSWSLLILACFPANLVALDPMSNIGKFIFLVANFLSLLYAVWVFVLTFVKILELSQILLGITFKLFLRKFQGVFSLELIKSQ